MESTLYIITNGPDSSVLRVVAARGETCHCRPQCREAARRLIQNKTCDFSTFYLNFDFFDIPKIAVPTTAAARGGPPLPLWARYWDLAELFTSIQIHWGHCEIDWDAIMGNSCQCTGDFQATALCNVWDWVTPCDSGMYLRCPRDRLPSF